MKQALQNYIKHIKRRSRQQSTSVSPTTDSPPVSGMSDIKTSSDKRTFYYWLSRILQHRADQEQRPGRNQLVVRVVLLGIFVLMALATLLLRTPASAAPEQAFDTTPTSVATATATPQPTNICPDGTPTDENGKCKPSQFDADKCVGNSNTNGPLSDPCNPWGMDSSDPDSTNAAEWEALTPSDQSCIYHGPTGASSYIPNSNLDIRTASTYNGSYNSISSGISTTQSCVDNSSGNSFPCAQTENDVEKDWLSGDWDTGAYNQPLTGHLERTYPQDTLEQGNVSTLYPYMLGLGLLLLSPSIIFVGYQLLLSASSFRYAEAISALSRVFLAAAAIFACYSLLSLLISFSNSVDGGIVDLHDLVPYPTPQAITSPTGTGPSYYIGYTLAFGDNTANASDGTQEATDGTILGNSGTERDFYRGIVVPINRWGCAANDFVSIVSERFWNDFFASFIPFFSNFATMAGKITSAIAVVHHLGEFIQTILSIGLAAQVAFRLIMINFYILTGPLACGCWGLPGGTGQKIVVQWLKGFCSLLFVQGAQLFVLTVTPLIFPDLSQIHLPVDSTGLLTSIFAQLPSIIVLLITLSVPRIMGTSATRALSAAGTMASGAVAAAGAAIYSLT
jgi:hypothetical protein